MSSRRDCISGKTISISSSPLFSKRKELQFTDVYSLNENGGSVNKSRSNNSMRSPFFDAMSNGTSSKLYDSGLGSPTPGGSPKAKDKRLNVSPIPFDSFESDDGMVPSTPDSPPHCRMRSLRLYDTPHTPKSLLQKSQRRYCRALRMKDQDVDPDQSRYKIGLDPTGPQANVNPFTSISTRRSGLKRSRPDLDGSTSEESPLDEMEEDDRPHKRLALHEINTSRYIEEFHQISKIGDGEFGSVYKCVNRLDGCTYAIKKSKMPVAGSSYERNALNEVYAHAVLGKHAHVLRYYSAWAEDDHMYIQNEYCNGGSLADLITECRTTKMKPGESELAQILLQVAKGLKYIHSQGLVHLDIKPANLFIHREPTSDLTEHCLEEDFTDDETEKRSMSATYKIGDLGHVTFMTSPIVEEGDCRYLPLEILHEQFQDLPKADIFSLALSIYEVGSSIELPKNGPEWHAIREGKFPDLPHVSKDFSGLLKSMASEDPKRRPTALSLLHSPILCPFHKKSRAQLYKELNHERLRNEKLSKELFAFRTSNVIQSQEPTLLSNRRSARLLGRLCNRSASVTAY